MKNLESFDRKFPTDDACKAYILAKRWPDGVQCPRCHSREEPYPLKGRPFRWVCNNKGCGGRGIASPSLPRRFFRIQSLVRIWFKIGYLMLTAKEGHQFATGPAHYLRRGFGH